MKAYRGRKAAREGHRAHSQPGNVGAQIRNSFFDAALNPDYPPFGLHLPLRYTPSFLRGKARVVGLNARRCSLHFVPGQN